MSEAFMPLENRGVRYESSKRPCDDPYINFQRIRKQQLWEDFENRRKQEAENARVAATFKPK